MLVGVTPLAQVALAEVPAGLSNAVQGPFARLIRDPDAEYVVLLIARPFDATATATVEGFPQILGATGLASPSYETVGGEVNKYLSDRGFITEPSDTPANQAFRAVLQSPYALSQRLFSGNDLSDSAAESFGEVTILNDGSYDDWAALSWDGREVEIKVGGPDFAYDEFQTIFSGTADGVEMDRDQIVLRLRDRRFIFQQNIQRTVYDGSGDLEGNDDLTGTPKPIAYGEVENVTPVTLDEAQHIYQVHDGSIQAINGVRDSGSTLTFTQDVATYVELKALTTGAPGSGEDIEVGEYATCLAQGVFRLGGTPDGDVTADVEGENGRGGYVNRIGAIARRIVTTRLGAENLSDPEDVDVASVARFDDLNQGTAGYYVNGNAAISDVLRGLLSGLAGYWFFTRAGLFSIGQLTIPLNPVATFSERDVRGEDARLLPRPPASYRRRVGYRRQWTVQGPNDLASGVGDAARELYGNEFRYASDINAATQARRKLARDQAVETPLLNEADASAEATRQLQLYSTDRNLYTISLNNALFRFYLGDIVNVQAPFFDLSTGKDLFVIGIEEDFAADETVLELWG